MKTLLITLALLIAIPAFSAHAQQHQLSCDELKRRSEIHSGLVSRSRNRGENELAAVMSKLIILRQRYQILSLKLRAARDKPSNVPEAKDSKEELDDRDFD